MGDEYRRQPVPQVPFKNKNRGPRSIYIDRWKNGFGFTLRHFVVYPPESYMVMAKEKRLGLRLGNANLNEPMDTIFVKAVHEGTPAHAAGLETGDRILSVNGEAIAGKTYAQVVQLMHNTPERLHLLVVPKEEDIIQQYYSDTAHNPKTNVRPRLRSPEIFQDHKTGSALSLPGPQKTIVNQKMLPIDSSQHESHSSDLERTCTPLNFAEHKTDSNITGSTEKRILKAQGSRYLNDECSEKVQTDQVKVVKTVAAPLPSTSYPSATGCRLSLDGGMFDRRESSSSSTLTDDSVIMSRIRKSCEQKEEFLRNIVTPMYSQIIAREFYARPQKLQRPVWPPNSPEIEYVGPRTSALSEDERTMQKIEKYSLNSSSNIHETSLQSFKPEAFDSDAGDSLLSSPISRSLSEESDSGRVSVTQPKLHIVSRRTRQFETGQLEAEDKMNFYRSELSRLSSKKNVPNVAVRKQEFERVVKDEKQTPRRGNCLVENYNPIADNSSLSGNRTVIVGSKQVHVDPPKDFRQLSPEKSVETPYKHRSRSNSVENWSSKSTNSTKRSVHGASIDRSKGEEKQRHKAVRQDSYLAAVKPLYSKTERHKHTIQKEILSCDSDESFDEDLVFCKQSLPLKEEIKRPSRLSFLSSDESNDGSIVPDMTVPINKATEVLKRPKNTSLSVLLSDRTTRRVSYLKATSSDEINSGLDKESDASILKSNRKWIYPMLPGDIQRLRRIFEEYSGIIESGGENHSRKPIVDSSNSNFKEIHNLVKEGGLNCKIAVIEGKRAGDRSWRQVWAVLKGPYFLINKDKQSEQPEHVIDIRSCIVDTPQDYTKKKNVFRLKTETDTEYLLQADDQEDMAQWKELLSNQLNNPNSLPLQVMHKGIKKLSSVRNRSPTGQSPASKTRKSSQQEQSLSPKSKTWKGKLGIQFKKMHQTGSSSSPPVVYPEGATIKVPLELCPPSSISEYIPMIVEKCTSIVEARGLEIVGIYRVPGNTAAVTALTEAVNKGIELMSPEDPRWNDVNVISSLLKSFFRNLPDSLFTSDLYPKFIEADKILDSKLRMVTLRKLIKELPEHNYETLKHLLFHLKKIVSKSFVNKMETRNLAIVFGPTLLSTGDLKSLVTDAPHQCRIVESLISCVDWFFSDSDISTLENLSLPMASESQVSETPSNANLLLGNLHKIEGYHSPNKDMSPRDIVSSIISAANRKISKGKSKKLEKPLVQFETENKPAMKNSETKEVEPSSSVTTSIVDSFVGEMIGSGSASLKPSLPLAASPSEAIASYSGLDSSTLERIKRFEQETQAMLQRAPVRIKRNAEKWLTSKEMVELKLQQAKRELENEDIVVSSSVRTNDLKNKSNVSQLTSQEGEANVIRRGTSCENLKEIVSNESLKRFKSNKEDYRLRTAASLDSLQERSKNEFSGNDNCLVSALTENFDSKIPSVCNKSDTCSIEDDNKSVSEKTDLEFLVEKQSNLFIQNLEKKIENNVGCDKAKSEEIKKYKLKIDPKIKEKLKNFEINETVLRTKNADNSTNLKRSESLNKPDKPEVTTKLKRSESLNKNEKENDFTRLKRSESSKNDLKRSDSLTKHEKTETNLHKRKQEIGLKRSLSKEKENIMLVKLKRKNGMPDRSIKRRHTVGGTKDFDKLPWLDNRLQYEALNKEESLRERGKRNLRTSSPDLSSSRLKATIESERLSIEVSLLGTKGNVLATLRKSLIAPSSTGRPQSMPPVSQIFKLPLESHV